MDFKIENYLETGLSVASIAVVVGLFLLFVLRNKLKTMLASTGYRDRLTDASFSEHLNRDVIYDNEKVALLTGLNFKTFLYYMAISASSLLFPLAGALVYVKYKYSLVKEKIEKTKNFSLFNIEDKNDKFINYLNENSGKINLCIKELLYASYFFMVYGILVKDIIIIGAGLSIPLITTITYAVIVFNVISYKQNYKLIEFYQLTRLIQNSNLNIKNSEFFVFGFISLISNFSHFQGISVYFWSILALRFLVSLLISKVLKREDSVNQRHQEIENREYTVIESIASYPNPKSQSRGYKFTSLLQMKFYEIEKIENGKNLLHIDNYAFFPQAINRTDLRKNPLLKETLQKSVKTYFETLDITKQVIALGGMGSGKTEMLNYIVEQIINSNFSKFKSIVYNDIKGDFSKNFARLDRDIIVNLYDERASVWCPFLEMKYNIESGTSFITNLFESIAGKEKDFFNASAKMKTATWLQESYFATNNNIDAWDMFFNKIKDYEEEIKATDDKTQSSILATIQIALEILNIMYYQIVVEKRKTFTFTDFVYQENIQLFFVNNKQYEAKLTPYLTGLMATYINTGMAKEDTKEHLIFNALDEFLTMKIDEETRRTLLTATRSKGFANWIMGQYLPKDEKLMQELDSSRYALITFNINDDYTLEKVAKKLSEAEILVASSSEGENKSQTLGGGEANNNIAAMGGGLGMELGNALSALKYKINYSLGQSKVVFEQQLQSMPKFHHLTFIPSEEVKVLSGVEQNRFFRLMAFGYDKLMANLARKNDFLARESGILYLGYTPQAKLSYDNKSFVSWDMSQFYNFKLGKENKNNKKVLSEKESFGHWLNLKFIESDEDLKDYLLKNNLIDADIDAIFSGVEEDSEKVLELISKYSEIERYRLMDKFFDIPLSDLDSKYKFCKENNLIGAILGIFTFSEEFRNNLLNGEIEIND